ncbi:translesion DNA synthesis-associated protein ImuA [Marinihelvus fidelis]|uniref:Translesion DNA synthesis-associated protein ImuA n=1 Tax=Marinihelvus fidelis TaxID=2613842 RepID=A0A5N0TBB7_9GAMM|nr:translesion DNA synthesis-associated protein ImuA [Marinihelvus fidelis]KAA9132041.1 translesion DNA synthesis-associated protein ImuA [Marinihelvus fidelis]
MRPAPRQAPGHPLVWRGGQRQHALPVLPSGHPVLDQHLPGGGWPVGALTELRPARPGLGEFWLLLPLLARVTHGGGWAILVNPPWIPYPPALRGHGIELKRLLRVQTGGAADTLWACEQALRGARGGTVLAWAGDDRRQGAFSQLRRLQLAARDGHKPAFLFAAPGDASRATPAALCLGLDAGKRGLEIRLLKCRGHRPAQPIHLRRPHDDDAIMMATPIPTGHA